MSDAWSSDGGTCESRDVSAERKRITAAVMAEREACLVVVQDALDAVGDMEFSTREVLTIIKTVISQRRKA